MPKEIAAPPRTHMTGTNQRLDPTLPENFRIRMIWDLPNLPASHASGDCDASVGRIGDGLALFFQESDLNRA